jgi:signal transduction histidine kinase
MTQTDDMSADGRWAARVAAAAATPSCAVVPNDDGGLDAVWANAELFLRFPEKRDMPRPLAALTGMPADLADKLTAMVSNRRSGTIDFAPVRYGHQRLWRISVSPVMTGPDDPPAAVLTFVDHTEDLWLREQLERAHTELAAATADRMQVMARVVHELRTPLNAILGYSQIIEGGAYADDRTGRYAGNIRQAGEHLLSLVNDILDFAKVSGGAIELEEAPCDIAVLVQAAVDMTRPTAQVRDIDLLTAVADDLPPIQADARRIVQVLVNLLSNAVKFTAPGGQVLISADRDPDGRPFFAIMDTGVGIPGTALEKVMMPFGQIDAAQAGQPKGTGLGLPVTREIVKRHGGELEVMTTEGNGSIFVAKLPAGRMARSAGWGSE